MQTLASALIGAACDQRSASRTISPARRCMCIAIGMPMSATSSVSRWMEGHRQADGGGHRQADGCEGIGKPMDVKVRVVWRLAATVSGFRRLFITCSIRYDMTVDVPSATRANSLHNYPRISCNTTSMARCPAETHPETEE